MSPARRQQVVDREHPSLSIVRQCALLGVSRSSLYYRPRAISAEDLSLMGEMDRQYLETPFYGSRRMKAWLGRRGIHLSRKRVQRLMRAMGLRAIYRRPSTSRRSAGAPGLPLPAEECENHPAQPGVGRGHHLPAHEPGVPLPGGGDGLAQPVRSGLAAVQHPGGRLLCRGAGGGPGQGRAGGVQHRPGQPVHQPGVHPGPQGPRREDQHGREGAVLRQHLRGAAVEDGEVRGGVPEAYANVLEAQRGLEDYFRFYNGLRPHQALGYRTPAEVFHGEQGGLEEESNGRRCSPGEGTGSLAGASGLSLSSALILS